MKLVLASITVAILGIGSANATDCKNKATNYPQCDNNAVIPNVSSSSVAGAIGVGAAIGNQQRNTNRSTASAVGGTQALNNANSINLTNGGSTVDASGNGATVNVNAGDGSDGSRAVAWAPVVPGPAAPPVATANMIVKEGVCGPLVYFDYETVQAKQIGVFGGQYNIEQAGFQRMTFQYATIPFIEHSGYRWGHKITKWGVVVGASTAGSFSVGGFSGDKGAQGGSGGSGSLQQLVFQYDAEQCQFERMVPVAAAYVEPVRTFTPAIVCPAPVLKRAQAHRPALARANLGKAKPRMCS